MSLANHWFAALALAYFRADRLPSHLVEIPLEYFERAVRWIKQRDDIASDRLGLLGVSRGSELAMLLATRMPDVRAVVAYAPMNAVSYGIPPGPRPWEQPRRATWTYGGALIPFYAGTLPPPEDDPAVIPVEQIRGPVLLIAGASDRLAPSAAMGEAVIRRLRNHGHRYRDTLVTYADAGHSVAFPYIPVTPRLSLGGTAPGMARADRDSWQVVLQFLSAALGANLRNRHNRQALWH
jgi:dienelactone hydrolase